MEYIQKFIPEGWASAPQAFSLEELSKASINGDIIQAKVSRCDSNYNLYVDLGNNIAVVDTAETNELPVEAIKSRIDFETLKQNLETGENSISNEDVKTLEISIKDTVVDKNDTIATLYKSNEVIGQKSDKKELDINSQKDLKVEKVSQNTEKVEAVV